MLILVLFVCTAPVYSQKDSIRLAERFLKICNDYKYSPLQLSIEYKTSSNYFVAEDDTTTIKAEFFLEENKAYVKFGEVEEVIDDSIALLISSQLKKMILYKNAAEIRQQVKGMFELKLSKGNAKKILENFSIMSTSDKPNEEVIKLVSRKFLGKTDEFPAQTLVLKYDTKKVTPTTVSDIQNQMLSISYSEFDSLQSIPAMKNCLVVTDGQYFIVKEKKTVYQYTRIAHEMGMTIPVKIKERVSGTLEGIFKPINTYQEYTLSVEN